MLLMKKNLSKSSENDTLFHFPDALFYRNPYEQAILHCRPRDVNKICSISKRPKKEVSLTQIQLYLKL